MKIVYFDIDQTLLRANEKAYEEIRKNALVKLRRPYGSLKEGVKFVKAISEKYRIDMNEVQEAYNNAAKEFFEKNEIKNFIDVYAGVSEMLSELYKSDEIKLGIISNGDSGVQRKKIESLEKFFDENLVIISGDVGTRKPEEKIYEIAKERAGAGNIFFVDDDAKNVEGAKDAGFVGILSKWSEDADGGHSDEYKIEQKNGIYIARKPSDVVKIINDI